MTPSSRTRQLAKIQQAREALEAAAPKSLEDAVLRLVLAQQALRQAIEDYERWRAKASRS